MFCCRYDPFWRDLVSSLNSSVEISASEEQVLCIFISSPKQFFHLFRILWELTPRLPFSFSVEWFLGSLTYWNSCLSLHRAIICSRTLLRYCLFLERNNFSNVRFSCCWSVCRATAIVPRTLLYGDTYLGMNVTILWVIAPCNPYVNWLFGGTYHLHSQCW
jgi:hypothetical protein